MNRDVLPELLLALSLPNSTSLHSRILVVVLTTTRAASRPPLLQPPLVLVPQLLLVLLLQLRTQRCSRHSACVFLHLLSLSLHFSSLSLLLLSLMTMNQSLITRRKMIRLLVSNLKTRKRLKTLSQLMFNQSKIEKVFRSLNSNFNEFFLFSRVNRQYCFNPH